MCGFVANTIVVLDQKWYPFLDFMFYFEVFAYVFVIL